jgi:transcriptional regulator with XRE-family HTH domain
MTLRQRVTELRKVQGISQRALAKKANLSRISIARLEAGNQKGATWQTARKLARAFGLSMDDFLRDVEDIEPAAVRSVES